VHHHLAHRYQLLKLTISPIPQLDLDQIDQALEQMETPQTKPDDGKKSMLDIQLENPQNCSADAKKPLSDTRSGCGVLDAIENDGKLQQQSLDPQDSTEIEMPNLKRLKELLLESQEVVENAERLAAGYKPALLISSGRHHSDDAFVPELKQSYGDSEDDPTQNRSIILSGLLAAGSHHEIGTLIANYVNNESEEDFEEDDESDEEANNVELARKCKRELAAAYNRFNVGYEDSSQEITVVPQWFGLSKCIHESLAGRNVTDMSNANVESHTISPIPMSCEAVLAQTYQDSPPVQAETPSTTAKESRDQEFFQRAEALDNKIEQWLNRKKCDNQVESNAVSSSKRKGKALGVFEDNNPFWLPESSSNIGLASMDAPEDDEPVWLPESSSSTAIVSMDALEDDELVWLPGSSSETGLVSKPALENLSSLRRPGYLQHNSFFLEANAAKKEINNMSLKEELLDELEKCPMYLSRNPNMARVWPETSSIPKTLSISHLVDGHVELGDITIGSTSSPTSPVDSDVFEDALKTLSTDESTYTADQVFRLTSLNENVVPRPSSPVQTSVDAGWTYGSEVVVEDDGPPLRHPTQFLAFDMMGVIAYLETILKRWLGLGVVVPGGYSVTVEGEMVERPRNLSPRRAQRQ